MEKFLVDNWMLVALACVSGGMLLGTSMRGSARAGAVGPAEAVRLINREKGVLIDVSEPAEFAASHPSGARNVPFGQLESSKELPANKSLPLVLVCPSGSRAGKAAALLRRQGYENARALAGGLGAWREASLPTERSAA